MRDVVVIGGGHNGLVAACYLARAGLDVVVLEQSDKLGGGTRTDELIPGYRFDTHSVAHNLIQATDLVDDLALEDVGLRYVEMDPFSVAVGRDGAIVRFHRSVERTVASIAEVSPVDADRYRAWMRDAMPLVRVLSAGLSGSSRGAWRRAPGLALAAGRALRRNGGPVGVAELLASPYRSLLEQRLATDRVRGPVAAFAAHASASPGATGSALFGLWQAFYHQVGQWHPLGGSQALADALARRLAGHGGEARAGAPVERILRRGNEVAGVVLADGSTVAARCVVAAVEPQVALLELLDPPLTGPVADRLRTTHRGNAVQSLVLLAVDRLPAYPGARPGDHAGLQSFVDALDPLVDGFAQAEAGRLPADPVPTYAFTPSALDPTLAPAGRHTVYLACPCAPARLRDGWAGDREAFADRMIDTVEDRAPGFRGSIVDQVIRTPADMATELRWHGAHTMHLDVSLDQLGPLRPTRALAGHRTPVAGLFISGAGTAPVGGVSGAPGRATARAVLRSFAR
ncbi:NAD(P)/FAD-dependent oxidoreductase [Modestobacter sp. KNN46-3]|uniref:phytoene desaturase family protein n=1 Tax=Modestobacter sp. KNN46-3 TaxID=2711218 RepID=UPI0013E0CE4E|nr:NAD(P)/FAD-dependent oxidoreductase [Modestobacter sp. KNN46-3]